MDMRAIHGEGRQYEIGKWYKAEEESGFLKGFCFCKKIEQIDWYYPLKKNRLFEIEAENILPTNGDNLQCLRIRFVREISQEEILEYAEKLAKEKKDFSFCVKKFLIRYGVGIDRFLASENWKDRYLIAEEGIREDILAYDENAHIRALIASKGKSLDILVKDESWFVRMAVAKCGRDKDLDVLVYDKDQRVRCVVAGKGRPKDLKMLAFDEDWHVRLAVNRVVGIRKGK